MSVHDWYINIIMTQVKFYQTIYLSLQLIKFTATKFSSAESTSFILNHYEDTDTQMKVVT